MGIWGWGGKGWPLLPPHPTLSPKGEGFLTPSPGGVIPFRVRGVG